MASSINDSAILDESILSGTNEDEIMKYVPEDVDHAATVSLACGTKIAVWKSRVGSDKFKIQWLPKSLRNNDLKAIINSSLPLINEQSCYFDDTIPDGEIPSLRYQYKDMSFGIYGFDDLKGLLGWLKSIDEPEDYIMDVLVIFEKLEDLKYIQIFDNHTKFEFYGDWYTQLIENLKIEDDYVGAIAKIPINVRLYCQDSAGYLIIQRLLKKKNICATRM